MMQISIIVATTEAMVSPRPWRSKPALAIILLVAAVYPTNPGCTTENADKTWSKSIATSATDNGCRGNGVRQWRVKGFMLFALIRVTSLAPRVRYLGRAK